MSTAPQFPPNYREPQGPRAVPPSPKQRSTTKKILLWVAGIIGGLIVLMVIAATIALHSRSAHEYLLRTAKEKASAALGANVQLRDFALHFSGISPTLDLYNVVISSAPPHPNPPLAEVQRVHVAVTVASLLHRKWYINEIQLIQPIVRLQVDTHGNSNIPKPKGSGTKSNMNVFDLGIRHARIENGEIYYNDHKTDLNADLHQLNFISVYDPGQHSYSGRLSYRDGKLLMQNFAPVPHALDAEFVATPETFTLKRATLHSGNSSLDLAVTVQDYSNPKLDAHYSANLDSSEFRRILKNQSLPTGIIHASGALSYANQQNKPLVESVSVNGNLGSRRLLVQMPSFHGAIDNIGATYKIAQGNLLVPNFHAALLGGELTASLSTRDLTGNSRSHLTADMRGLSLRSAQTMMHTPFTHELGVTGTLNAHADATWGKTLDDLLARADAAIKAQVEGATGGSAVPVNGSVHANYDAKSKQVALANSFVHTGQTSLTMNGVVSKHSALQVNLQANDLHELEALAVVIYPGQNLIGLYGTASLRATITGRTDAPQVSAQLSATNLRVRGTNWRLLRANASLSPSQVKLQNGELDPVGPGHISFALGAGLEHWSFTKASPVQVSFNASQINLGEIMRGTGMQAPVSGTFAAAISMHGSEQSPVGNGSISLTVAKIANEPVKSLTLQFNGTGETVVADLNASIPAGVATAKLTLHPKQKTYEAQLNANGIQLDKLQTLKQRNVPVTGVINLDADGKGTFDNPGLNARLEIPKLNLRGQTITDIELQTSLANHVGTFNLHSAVINTAINGHGTVHFTGDYPADAALDTQAIPFGPLVAAYAPSEAGNIGGQTELHVSIHGPLKRKDLLQAHLTIPQLSLNYKNNIQIAATEPIHADYVNGVLQVARGSLRGTDTNLEFQGTVPLTTDAPASVLLKGSMDLKVAQMFDPDIVSSGQVQFDIDSYGKRSDPNVNGQIRITNVNVTAAAVPLGLQNGNGVLTLLKDRLQITQFNGLIGGGDFSASGGVIYRPAMRFDVGLSTHDTRVLYNNIRGAFNTKLVLMGTLDSAQLQGQVSLEQLQFTPAFDLMDFMGELGGGAATPPPVGGFQQALSLNIGIKSTAGVNLVSRTMSLQAATNLRLTGTAAQPVMLGRVNLNGGDLIFRGNRYVLQGGTIDFVNSSQTEPVVNVSVNTQVQQYNVQMHFWGPADHLHINYSSDPALPPSDIINLIAFGQTQEASAANPNPPGSLAAEQLVASQVSSQITSRVEKVAGLSQLSVDPLLGTNQGESPGARITVQQRVTGKIFVTFSTDTTSTQNSVIKLEYHQSPRVSYSGTRDQNGGFGFDRRIHKEW